MEQIRAVGLSSRGTRVEEEDTVSADSPPTHGLQDSSSGHRQEVKTQAGSWRNKSHQETEVVTVVKCSGPGGGKGTDFFGV